MTYIEDHDALARLYCTMTGKYLLYISLLPGPDGGRLTPEEYSKAASWLDLQKEHRYVYRNGFGYFELNTQEAAQLLYDLTVGEAGPTELNTYNGPAVVYARLYGPNGVMLAENTKK